MAYYSKTLDITCGLPDAACFGIKGRMTNYEDRPEHHRRRSAAGRSLARLIARGLLEHCSRGQWRLTRAGFKVARRLWPDIRRPTRRELARNIVMRKALSSLPGVARRRRRKGIEVDL
jgi:hypothetical protein